jgi:16S rRNA (uracil1498-N3)-methyltransferase
LTFFLNMRPAMSERFFVSPPIVGERAELTGDEARHLAAVMRAAVGDAVTLFDGSGAEFAARITAIKKHAVELAIESRSEAARELSRRVTLAVALPKGERQKWLVEKATELGVTRLVPLTTQRGVAQPTDSALERLGRTVIEACKQCGRNRLLEIAPPQTAGDYFRQPTSSGELRLLADPGGLSVAELAQQASKCQGLLFAIGPEGGFTGDELVIARAAGWQLVSLGPRILRVETAAIALAAWASLGDKD